MTERPELHELRGATGMHSRVRYAFAAHLASGQRVLDIACGNGFGTARLAESAASVVGADTSAEAIATAQATFARSNVTYQQVPSARLPFGDGSFDVVVCLETLEHLPRNRHAPFIAELRRVLAPGGLLVMSTPERNVERRYELATGAFNPWHAHTPAREELEALLRDFPQRLSYGVVDLIATVVGAEGSRGAPQIENRVREIRSPFTHLQVCALSPDAIRRAEDRMVQPLGLREEPRLGVVEAAMDALPFRLRWAGSDREQALRTEAGMLTQDRPGSARWWHRQAIYAFAARLATGRRALDVACGLGTGAARLQMDAREVVATDAPGAAIDAARSLYDGDSLEFVPSATLLPAQGPFDVIVAVGAASADRSRLLRDALPLLASDGVIVSDVPLAGVASVPLVVSDLVATTVVRETTTDVERARFEGDAPRSSGSASFHASSPSAAALARTKDVAPVAVLRGDFQWDALAAELFTAERVHDVGGFAPDERLEILALRLMRLEREMESRLLTLARRMDAAADRLPLLSVSAMLRKLRRSLGGSPGRNDT